MEKTSLDQLPGEAAPEERDRVLSEYFYQAAELMMRPPGGLLRHSYLVPGGLYHSELWDWDCFWAAKGLLTLFAREDEAKRSRFIEHAQGSWVNFLEHQAENGAIPILIKETDGDVFGCKNGAGDRNQAKPILGQFAWDIGSVVGSYDWVAPHFNGLLRFYERWTDCYGTACGLLVWGSDVAIGVDCDPTTYGRPEFSSANLLLNCLFYRDLLAAAGIAGKLGRFEDVASLKNQAKGILNAVQKECWDPQDEFFYTVDVQSRDHRDVRLPGLNKGMEMSWQTIPLKIKMFTGFLPMWAGIATKDQAERLVERHLMNAEGFQAPWGIRSLSRQEKMYDPDSETANPSNWLGPIWVVANYMIYEGLLRYGFEEEASILSRKIGDLLFQDLSASSTLHECYCPETGKPNFNENFISWNTLILLMKNRESAAFGSAASIAA